ncbi:MAG TPA: hypothetical protein VGA08_00870 [Candidatus Saccharimonadales bacterium]
MQPNQVYFDPNATQIKQRKMIKLIISLAVATFLVLLLGLLFRSSEPSRGDLGLTLARHNELVRVIDEFEDEAQSIATKQLLARTKLVLISGANELMSIGVAADDQQVSRVKVLDATLIEAVGNNTFDSAITDLIRSAVAASEHDLALLKDPFSNTETSQTINNLLADYAQLL